jgi:hypothetical protein
MTFVAMSAERLLSRLYGTFSVPMTFTSPLSGLQLSLQVIDRTAGVEIAEQKNFVPTVKPVASVRASDLAALSIDALEMVGVTVWINEIGWKVKATMPKPGPAGAVEGETYLILTGRDGA